MIRGNSKVDSSRALAACFSLIAGLALASCDRTGPGSEAPGNAAAAAVANPCTGTGNALSPTMPQNAGTDQLGVDCFAWQEFVALNWRADPAKPGYPDPNAAPAQFGLPTDASPAVWETYLEAADVFGGTLQGTWQAKRPATKRLFRTSKFHALDLSDITQAGGGHHWLTNQRGDITYYEVMMNRDEYDFITQKGFDLTTAAGQASCASQPGQPVGDAPPPHTGPLRGGFNMPQGMQPGWQDTDCAGNARTFGDGVGAMEIKASWTPLPADGSLNYRYKTAQAQIQDPVTKQMRTVTVGLVGLHIARKRFPRAQWTWSTFEHIDNTPDEASNAGWKAPTLPANANRKPSPGFTFFNPKCDPATNAYKCVHNAPPTRCMIGTNPATCQRYNVPMQITRLRPVDDRANQVTAWFWSLLPANSVFNYYRLVDVQWPNNRNPVVPPGARTPADKGNATPPGNSGGAQQIVANTTMESFQQDKNACMDCHAFASIAQPSTLKTNARGLRQLPNPQGPEPAPYASDFSFLFATETKR
jgi:hypothetical protein